MNPLKQAIQASATGPMEMKDEATVARTYCFPEDFMGFSGHFPGYPILPALVQLMTGWSLLEAKQGHAVKIATIERAKFLLEIYPGQKILVQCKCTTVNGMAGGRIKIMKEDQLAASFSVTFKESKESED